MITQTSDHIKQLRLYTYCMNYLYSIKKDIFHIQTPEEQSYEISLNNLITSPGGRNNVLMSNQNLLDADFSMLDSQKLIWMKLINQDLKLSFLQESQKQMLANQIIISQNQNLLFKEIQDQSEKNRMFVKNLALQNNIFTLYAKEIQVNTVPIDDAS